MHMSDNLLVVGVITGTHGVRGEVKVFPLTDDISRFSVLKEAFLTDKDGRITDQVDCIGYKKIRNFAVLKFSRIQDMESAEKIKNKYICVERKNSIKLPQNSYFICDIIGLEVFDPGGKSVGAIKDVIQTGANDVYCIGRPGKKDLLLPAIKQIVKHIDIEDKKIIADIPEDLIEIYD